MSTNHLMGVYNRAPLEVERGRGARLWSTDGTEYLDCVAGISTNGLGHAHPELVQAVKDQAEKLWHVSNIFRIPGQEALADALCDSSFADVVFFTNSGTEAVECALKTARKYHSANGAPERIDIYGFDGSFHGRTYGAINAAANPSYTDGFGPAMQGFHQLKWGDHEAIKAAVANPTTAAIIVEPVQGEGGNQRSGPMAGSNVVVTLGDGPRDIVLTAHYDAVKLSDGSMSQGVVDNAGSVLAMIEAMKTLKGQATDHRLIFVLTDQEELGLIGAKAWLAAHDKSRIHAVINADVAAYGRTVMYGENNGGQSGFVLGALRAQCAEQAVDCVAFPIYPPSDDRVFSAAGVPVVSLGTQDAVGAHQMWLAFNGGEDNGLKEGFVPPVFQRIHSKEDKLSYLNGDDVARFGRFIVDLTLRLDRTAAEQ